MSRTHLPRKWRWLAVAALALTLWSQSFGQPPSAQPPDPAWESDNAKRFREGERVEALRGHFESSQGRLAFITEDGHHRFGALENLSLERVYRLIGDGQQSLRWEVSGTITEFRGANYLLLTRTTLLTGYRREVPE